jgi:hypothetical protein
MEIPAKRARGSIAVSGLAFYVGAIVLGIVLWILTAYLNARPYIVETVTDPAALSKAQDAHAAVGNLLTTLATGLFAGFGAYLTRIPKLRLSAGQRWRASLSILFIILSLYFGYIASQNLVWAVESSIGTLHHPKLQWPRGLQFYSIILGVLFFADFAWRDLMARD